MLSFFVSYFDPNGVPKQRIYQVNAEREHHHQAAVKVCTSLESEGCSPDIIAHIPGEYSPKELEELCKNGLPQCLLR